MDSLRFHLILFASHFCYALIFFKDLHVKLDPTILSFQSTDVFIPFLFQEVSCMSSV